MSDFEIEFGDVEETRPDKALRPDEDGRYAVALYGQPLENDLTVYVDLDVLRDMEEHALSDTTVELGGVMLGGQRSDADGRPFVVVEESLRARHYEATKGSFKFTHDTWERISREREAFPEELAMVGWYHTHPDWGVFLSGMDMFICDNFFNRPLDVALVIDPCRRDRGWFFWTNQSDRIRRAGGFVVYASRHRRDELESFVRSLEEEGAMPATRFPQMADSTRGGSAPVIVVPESRSAGWQGPFLAAALCIQTLALILFAYAAIGPGLGTNAATEENEETLARLSRIEERLLDAEESRRDARASEIELRIAQAKLDLVDRFAAGELGPADLATRTAAAEETARQLEDTVDAFRAERNQMEATIGSLTSELTKTQIDRKNLVEATAKLREERDAARVALAKYEKPKKSTKSDEKDAEEGGLVGWAKENVLWLGLSIAFALLLIGGTVALLQYRNETDEDEAGSRRDADDDDGSDDRPDASSRSPFE
jgi:proteasome lid subunit RPN8/RPN11